MKRAVRNRVWACASAYTDANTSDKGDTKTLGTRTNKVEIVALVRRQRTAGMLRSARPALVAHHVLRAERREPCGVSEIRAVCLEGEERAGQGEAWEVGKVDTGQVANSENS